MADEIRTPERKDGVTSPLPPAEAVAGPQETAEIKAVMIGGNHLASAMLNGGMEPSRCRNWTYDAVLDRYSQPYADMWVAWKAIMDLRDALEASRLPAKETP